LAFDRIAARVRGGVQNTEPDAPLAEGPA
jgi:hypothetical protein